MARPALSMESEQSARDFINRYDLFYCDQDSSTVATFIAQFSTLASAQFHTSAQPSSFYGHFQSFTQASAQF